jgi:hypothetical protein
MLFVLFVLVPFRRSITLQKEEVGVIFRCKRGNGATVPEGLYLSSVLV